MTPHLEEEMLSETLPRSYSFPSQPTNSSGLRRTIPKWELVLPWVPRNTCATWEPCAPASLFQLSVKFTMWLTLPWDYAARATLGEVLTLNSKQCPSAARHRENRRGSSRKDKERPITMAELPERSQTRKDIVEIMEPVGRSRNCRWTNRELHTDREKSGYQVEEDNTAIQVVLKQARGRAVPQMVELFQWQPVQNPLPRGPFH